MNGGDSGEVCGSKEEVKKDYDNGKDDAMEVDSDRMGTESEDKVSHIDHDQGRNPSENGDLLTKENGGNNATDNNLSVGDETLDDLKVDTNVDGLQGESKGMELESEVNNGKSHDSPVNGQTVVDSNVAKSDNDASVANGGAKSDNDASVLGSDNDGSNDVRLSEVKAGNEEKRVGSDDGAADMDLSPTKSEVKESKSEVDLRSEIGTKNPNLKFLYEPPVAEGDELGTEEEQAAFAKEVERIFIKRRA